MKAKADVRLNRSFGVVERSIFRLVLNGVHDAGEILALLSLFSDAVVANGVRRLVNEQILRCDLNAGTLRLADPLVAIIDACIERRIDLDEIPLPEKLDLSDGIVVRAYRKGSSWHTFTASLLEELIPGIKLDIYLGSLDFALFLDEQGD